MSFFEHEYKICIIFPHCILSGKTALILMSANTVGKEFSFELLHWLFIAASERLWESIHSFISLHFH